MVAAKKTPLPGEGGGATGKKNRGAAATMTPMGSTPPVRGAATAAPAGASGEAPRPQQRVSRLGKAVQDAATMKKKKRTSGAPKSTNRMDSRVDPSRMKEKNRSREGTSERLTPRSQSHGQQRMPAPRRPGGIDASMLSSPHRVTSPEHAQYHRLQSPTNNDGRAAAQREKELQTQMQRKREQEERENRALQQQQQRRKKADQAEQKKLQREREAQLQRQREQQQQQQQQQREQQQSQKPEKIAPRQPLPRARAPPPPEPGKLVPRQPIGRPAELPQQPQQPRQPRVVDDVTNESRPTSIRDIMVKKARDERKTEMRARKEKRKRANLVDGGGGASLEDGGSQPTKTGTTTLVHFEEDAPIANEEQRETEETPNAENGRRTRLRASSLGEATEKTSIPVARSAKTPKVKMTGASTLLKPALKKSSQVANNALASTNAPLSAQQQQVQNVHTPRVKIVDGQLVADQKTLTVQASHETRINESEFTRKTGDNTTINSQTYGNRSKPMKWSKQETELFYKAMEQFGTDFTLIQRLFPSRTRRQVKAKYLKEQNNNDARVETCMNTIPGDNGTYQNLIDVLQSDTSNRVEVVAGKGIDMIIPGANNVAVAAQVLHGETPMQENVETVFPQITDATAAAAAAPAGK